MAGLEEPAPPILPRARGCSPIPEEEMLQQERMLHAAVKVGPICHCAAALHAPRSMRPVMHCRQHQDLP